MKECAKTLLSLALLCEQWPCVGSAWLVLAGGCWVLFPEDCMLALPGDCLAFGIFYWHAMPCVVCSLHLARLSSHFTTFLWILAPPLALPFFFANSKLCWVMMENICLRI